ncbi:arrestin domain-containing protein 3-like [Mugil cephalus]|uniref:arrestin domain-containing protein 3-like n=1 Tax=Mugil cephalus TaxID=48193 RepID=UPI001FB78F41|nr:arrestin domain-containing protein 3-like [Mugil cephalus]
MMPLVSILSIFRSIRPALLLQSQSANCQQSHQLATGNSMSPIKDFSLTYEAINEDITFSVGDTITGTVTFNLTEDTKVKSVLVKVKGDANVRWTEWKGNERRTYSAHRRYFKLKEYFVEENTQGTVFPKGIHQFNFRFQIPQGDLPSSFRGNHGHITYMLEAKISRSWRRPSKTQTEISFVSKTFPYEGQVMCSQSGSVTKDIGTFSKAEVQLSATANKKVCSPGDTLSVVAKITNSSSKNVKPKFKLVQTTVYHASGSRKIKEKILAKVVGDAIEPRSEKTVSCRLKIPADAIYSIHNCEILTVEYNLKAYVDISFDFDPEVVFPLAVVAPKLVAMHLSEVARPNPPEAVGAQSYSDFPPPTFPAGSHPLPAGPIANEYPAPRPPQPANVGSGSNSQWPQNLARCNFLATAPVPPLVQPPAITVPPQFQQGEEPPPYTTLYPPPPYDTPASGSS